MRKEPVVVRAETRTFFSPGQVATEDHTEPSVVVARHL